MFLVGVTIFSLLILIVMWFFTEETHSQINIQHETCLEKGEEVKEVANNNVSLEDVDNDLLHDLDSLVTSDNNEDVFDGGQMNVRTATHSTNFEYENCYELGVSQADVGLILPFKAETSDFSFRPFALIEDSLKTQTVEALQVEFGSKITKEFVENKWTAGNVFYVLSFKTNGDIQKDESFIGCVGVDRMQFYPFISNLVVHRNHRGKKFGQLLLRLAERYAERFQFPNVKLWCAEKLVSYYLKQGYVKESYEDEQQVFILSKAFEKKRSTQLI
jgi:GNAT superfamily N-acetyltransferase